MSLLCGKCKKRFIDICGIWNEKGKLFTKAICHCGMFIYKGELSSLIDKNKTQSTQRYTIRYRKNMHNEYKEKNAINKCQFKSKEEIEMYAHQLMNQLEQYYVEYINKNNKKKQLCNEMNKRYQMIQVQNKILCDFLLELYDNYIKSNFTKKSYLNFFSFNLFKQFSPKKYTPNYICAQVDLVKKRSLTSKINILSVTFNSYHNYLIYYKNTSCIHFFDMTTFKDILRITIPFVPSSHFLNLSNALHLLYSTNDYTTFYIINANALSVNKVQSPLKQIFQSLCILKSECDIYTLALSFKNSNTEIYSLDINNNTMIKTNTINISFNNMIQLSSSLYTFTTDTDLIAYDFEKCLSKYSLKDPIRLITSINETTFALTTRNDTFHIFTYRDSQFQNLFTKDFYRTYITNVEGTIQSLFYSHSTLYLGCYDFIYLFDISSSTFTTTISNTKFCPSFLSSYHSSFSLSLLVIRCEDNCEVLSIEY